MLTPVGIRRAGNDDVAAINTLIATDQSSVPDAGSLLAAEGVFTYLAEDERCFGVVTAGVPAHRQDSGTGEILLWYIAEANRRAGWGRKLLVHGLSVLKRRFYDEAFIWLPRDAGAAVHIVEAFGFEPNGAERIDNRADTVSQGYVRSLADFF